MIMMILILMTIMRKVCTKALRPGIYYRGIATGGRGRVPPTLKIGIRRKKLGREKRNGKKSKVKGERERREKRNG